MTLQLRSPKCNWRRFAISKNTRVSLLTFSDSQTFFLATPSLSLSRSRSLAPATAKRRKTNNMTDTTAAVKTTSKNTTAATSSPAAMPSEDESKALALFSAVSNKMFAPIFKTNRVVASFEPTAIAMFSEFFSAKMKEAASDAFVNPTQVCPNEMEDCARNCLSAEYGESPVYMKNYLEFKNEKEIENLIDKIAEKTVDDVTYRIQRLQKNGKTLNEDKQASEQIDFVTKVFYALTFDARFKVIKSNWNIFLVPRIVTHKMNLGKGKSEPRQP